MSVSHSEPLGRMLSFLTAVNVLFFLPTLLLANTADIITEGPVSVSAPFGENALFHCNGSGFTIAWIVDGISHNHPDIVARGISDHTVSSSSGTVQSTLTVPATLVNNGTTVECRVVSFNGVVISNNATLTVLPGIGRVVNVRFTPSFSAVLWDPPATAGVLSGLSYIVIVMNNNTGQVIVSATTTNTSHKLPAITPCQYYTANVTAFSSEHHSDSVVTGQRVPGEYYDLVNVSVAEVASYNTTQSAVTFTVKIEQRNTQVCPDQDLISVTFPIKNIADRNSHEEMPVVYAGEVNYTAIVKSGYHYASDIKIIADDIEEVDIMRVLFSSYNVQNCTVSTDHTSILVECIFAINSTAPGIVVIQDDQSQYTINKTLQRLQQDSDKGSVNITGLPAGEYSVRVYDKEEDYSNNVSDFAFEHSKLLQIVRFTHPSIGTTYILPSVFPSASSHVSITPSPSMLQKDASTVNITAVSIGLSAMCVVFSMLLVIVTAIVVFVKLRVHKKNMRKVSQILT